MSPITEYPHTSPFPIRIPTQQNGGTAPKPLQTNRPISPFPRNFSHYPTLYQIHTTDRQGSSEQVKVPDGRRATYRKERYTSPVFWSAAIFAFFPTRRNFAAPYPTYPIETQWIRASPKAAALVLSSEKRRYRICLSPYGFSRAFHIFPFLTANERRVRNRSRDNR